MKKIFRTAAMLLGCTSCFAQAAKCPQQNETDQLTTLESIETETITETAAPGKSHALAGFQDLDKLYYL